MEIFFPFLGLSKSLPFYLSSLGLTEGCALEDAVDEEDTAADISVSLLIINTSEVQDTIKLFSPPIHPYMR